MSQVSRRWIVAGSLLACFLAASGGGIWWTLQPPRYRFQLGDRVVDEEDVLALAELAESVTHISEGQSEFARPEAVEELGLWIGQAGGDAESWLALTRLDSHELGRVNGMLQLLATHWPRQSPRELAELPSVERKARLGERLGEIDRERRAEWCARHLQTPATQRLLDRYAIARFPGPPSASVRSGLAYVLGTRLQDREAWLRSFTVSVRDQINPVRDLYRAMRSTDPIRLSADSGGELQLLPLANSGTRRGSQFLGFESTTDFALLWQEAAAKRTHRLLPTWDTGVRLVCIPWERADDDWRPEWPPAGSQAAADLNGVKRFLVANGLPRGFDVTTATVRCTGPRDEPVVRLRAGFSAPYLASWRDQREFELAGVGSSSFRKTLGEATAAMRASLVAELTKVTRFGGIPAAIGQLETGTGALELKMKHPQAGEITLSGSLNDHGELVWQGLPRSLGQRRAIVKAMTDRGLAPAADPARVRLRRIRFDALGKAQVLLATVKAKPAPRATKPAGGGSRPPANATAASQDPDEIRKELARVARRSFERLLPLLETHLEPAATGVQLRVAIKLRDWPTLQLGPMTVRDTSEVGPALTELLTTETVRAASLAQWTNNDEKGIRHPRYGKLKSVITQWDPHRPDATVSNTFSFYELGDVSFAEPLKLNDPSWEPIDQAMLADRLEVPATEKLDQLQDVLLGMFIDAGDGEYPIPRIVLDHHGIDGNRWLGMNPPRIAAAVEARVPYLGLPISAEGIIVGLDHIRAPEEVSAALPFTVGTPYLAISHPRVALGIRDPTLALGAKLTPPLPAVVGIVRDNPMLAVANTEFNGRGYFGKPRLDGEGNLTLATVPDMGQGSVQADFGKQALTGDLRGQARIPGLKLVPLRAGGQLAASGKTKEMTLAARARTVGSEVGRLDLSFGQPQRFSESSEVDPRGVGLAGKLQFPGIGNLHTRGGMNSNMNRYCVQGWGTVGPVACLVTATEKGVRRQLAEKTDRGVVYTEQWAADLSGLEQRATERETQQDQPVSEAAGELSPQEKAFVEKHIAPRPGLYFQGNQEFPTDVFPVTPTAPSRLLGARYQQVSMRLAKAPDTQAIQVYDTRATSKVEDDVLLAAIPADQWYAAADNTFDATVWANNQSLRILFVKKDQTAVADCDWQRATGQLTAQTDLTNVANQLWQPLGTTTAPLKARCLREWFAWYKLQLAGPITEPAVSSYTADSVEINFQRLSDGKSESRILSPRGTFVTFPELAGLAAFRRPAIANAIVASMPPPAAQQRVPRLVGMDLKKGRYAWLRQQVNQPLRGRLEIRDGQGAVTRQLEVGGVELNRMELVQRANLLFRGLETLPAAEVALKIRCCRWAVVAATEKSFHLVFDRRSKPLVVNLDREHFIGWTSKSARFLPPAWRTRRQRENVGLDELSRVASLTQHQLRNRKEYPVDPLGLIVALAREETKQAVKPSSDLETQVGGE